MTVAEGALDHLKFLSFWLAIDFIAFVLLPRLTAFLTVIPLLGAISVFLIGMPLFHTTALIYFLLLLLGATEGCAYLGAGVFVLFVVFCLAYWVAADDLRSGSTRM